MTDHRITRDGVERFRGTLEECLDVLAGLQPHDVATAIELHGWSIEPITGPLPPPPTMRITSMHPDALRIMAGRVLALICEGRPVRLVVDGHTPGGLHIYREGPEAVPWLVETFGLHGAPVEGGAE